MTFDPGMDRPPDQWESPEYDPGFAVVDPPLVPAENVENPIGEVRFADADEMHREMIDAIGAAARRGIEQGMWAGSEIIELLPGITQSQHIRFRVQKILLNRVTAGDAVFTVGTRSYTFSVGAAAPTGFDFPILIERGVDMTYTGDGRMYLLGWPE